MHRQFRVVKPVTKFDDLRFIPIVDVLSRAENFDCRKASVPDPLEPDRRQAMFYEEVSGKYSLHYVWSQISERR